MKALTIFVMLMLSFVQADIPSAQTAPADTLWAYTVMSMQYGSSDDSGFNLRFARVRGNVQVGDQAIIFAHYDLIENEIKDLVWRYWMNRHWSLTIGQTHTPANYDFAPAHHLFFFKDNLHSLRTARDQGLWLQWRGKQFQADMAVLNGEGANRPNADGQMAFTSRLAYKLGDWQLSSTWLCGASDLESRNLFVKYASRSLKSEFGHIWRRDKQDSANHWSLRVPIRALEAGLQLEWPEKIELLNPQTMRLGACLPVQQGILMRLNIALAEDTAPQYELRLQQNLSLH